jgi:hypothetical protein
MSYDRAIVDAIKVAQNLLWQNLSPTHNLSDAATVLRFRELVRSPAVLSTLERRSDKLLAFALRLEGIVSKRKDSAYRSGRSPDWLKMKNSDAPAVKREVEEEWGKKKRR